MPLRKEPCVSKGLLPFFGNLLPEGSLLELSTAKLKISNDDTFGLLLATPSHPSMTSCARAWSSRVTSVRCPSKTKKDRLTPRVWTDLAKDADIPEKAFVWLAQTFQSEEKRAVGLIEPSFLPQDRKDANVFLLRSRTGTFPQS